MLKGTQESLVLEAGVKLQALKKAMGFNLSSVVGCCISHQHNDHAGHAFDYSEAGIRLLAPQECLEAKQINRRNSVAVEQGKGYRLGGFTVYPFNVLHDVPCVGYVITHAECGKVVFFTDTYACLYAFKGVNQYLVEANYCDERLEANIASGKVPLSLRNRLLTSHMEIGNTIAFLRRNELKGVRNIVLVHLSDGNSNEEQFIERTVEATGKRVYAAKAGMVINFDVQPL